MTYYPPRHADLSHEGLQRCRDRDLRDSLTWPCAHHKPRPSAFVTKVRVVIEVAA